MLQSIIDRSKNNSKIIKNSNLKFIRSSSASLPVKTLKELEKVFNVPLIESYGMTEATHQMTTNLLPPFKRKPGSVGLAVGLKVKVVDNNFVPLSNEKEGEIIIKGDSVFKGYLANNAANKTSFSKGWFRTGDLGYFDKDGCLFISGRIKEIINRGGEKISPKEIDEVFIKHPKISKVITFSIKHAKLGEDVALAVVLKDKQQLNKSDVKDFAKNKLAPFKVPRNIYFLKDIPVGATGKIQRIGLAKKLGLEK
jgi:acyl-CoA synthetase (AMP-forming)/AMP-acid ligase II